MFFVRKLNWIRVIRSGMRDQVHVSAGHCTAGIRRTSRVEIWVNHLRPRFISRLSRWFVSGCTDLQLVARAQAVTTIFSDSDGQNAHSAEKRHH